MSDFFETLNSNILTNVNRVKPLLKWAGGKSRLLNILQENFFSKIYNKNITFYEPFAGSAIISFNSQFKKNIIGDKNQKLITFHSLIKRDYNIVYNTILDYLEIFNESTDKLESYNSLRNEFNTKNLSDDKTAALFWILNKTGFNGMYRETKKGKFNIPYGKRICPRPVKNDFKNVHLALQAIEIINGDYKETTKDAKSGDCVYFDPPYVPVNKTSNFSSYLSGGFSLEDQKELKEYILSLASKNISVIMSNSYCELTKNIFSNLTENNFKFEIVEVSRTISAKKESRSMVKEYVIHNIF